MITVLFTISAKKNEELSNLEVNWNSGNYEEIKKELDLCKEYSKKLSPQS